MAKRKADTCVLRVGKVYCGEVAEHSVVLGGKTYPLCPSCYALVEQIDPPAEIPTKQDTAIMVLRRAVNKWARAAKNWPSGSPQQQECLAAVAEYEQAIATLEQANKVPWAA